MPHIRGSVVGALVACLLGSGCAATSQAATVSATKAARLFGACGSDRVDNGAPAVSFVASVERWLEVRSTSDALRDPRLTRGSRSVTVRFDASAVRPGSVGEDARAPARVTLHNGHLPGIDWGLRAGGRVFLAMASKGYESPRAIYVIVEAPDGSHFFAGRCEYDTLTRPLQQTLGRRFDPTIRRIVGMTDPVGIMAALTPAGPGTPQEDQPVILSPGETDPAILASLDSVMVAFTIPDGWDANDLVCTSIAEGWNDCVRLAATAGALPEIGAYTDSDGTIAVWLVGPDADVGDPIERIGTVSLTGADRSLIESGNALVSVRLSGTWTDDPAAPIDEPGASLTGVSSLMP